MAYPKVESMIFKGKSGQIKASILTTERSSEKSNAKLAVVRPGAGYSCKEPLLYFAIPILLKKNFKVLAIDKIYGDDPEWTKIPTMEGALKVVEEDSVQLFSEIKEKFQTEAHTLLGRSLGTYAIACVLEKRLISPQQIV